MTQNQIDYLNAYNKRQRDIAELAETQRHDLVYEAETRRSNLAREQENVRSNLAREAENYRSNLEQERLKDRSLNIDFLNEGVSAQKQATNQHQYELDRERLNLEKQKFERDTALDVGDILLNIVRIITGVKNAK